MVRLGWWGWDEDRTAEMRDGRGRPLKEDSKVRVLGLEEREEEVNVVATDMVGMIMFRFFFSF